ncbi:hypothetical protein ACJIZ3_023483 [Penstemon smallii]|uniref:Uncharacterized protein n=1 Tax=Penstemon smallii TaxID=265156 RepID=A0ABD3TP74_9LAMI
MNYKSINLKIKFLDVSIKFLFKIKKQERVSRNTVQVQYTVITSISEDTSSCHTPLSNVGLPVDDHDKAENSDKTTARKRLFEEVKFILQNFKRNTT